MDAVVFALENMDSAIGSVKFAELSEAEAEEALEKGEIVGYIHIHEDYFEDIVSYHYFFTYLRNTFVVMNYVTGECLIIVRFWEVEFIVFVEIVYFKSCREDVVVWVDGFFYDIFYVVFVFYFAENFFYQVFDADYSGCAAEFIDDDSDALMFL